MRSVRDKVEAMVYAGRHENYAEVFKQGEFEVLEVSNDFLAASLNAVARDIEASF